MRIADDLTRLHGITVAISTFTVPKIGLRQLALDDIVEPTS
jgi:hypothetical protein